jgi:hypothetical protein
VSEPTTWVVDGDFGPGLMVPMQTGRGMNNREHYGQRTRRVKAEREVIAWELTKCQRPPIPCSVLLTRVAPSRGLDDDNLAGALKSIRDEVAAWLRVDDADRNTVRYRYAQARGPWAVRIQFGPPVKGSQGVLMFNDED